MLPKASTLKAPDELVLTEEQQQRLKEHVDRGMETGRVYVSGEDIMRAMNNYAKVPRHLHHHPEGLPFVGITATHVITNDENNDAVEREKRKFWLFVIFDAVLKSFKGKPIEGNYQK